MSMPTPPELVRLSVQQGKMPQYLFKYRTITTNLDKLLINGQLWFSSPKDFNDPFDCQTTIDTNNSQLEIEGFLRENTIGLPSSEIIRLAKATHSTPNAWEKMVNEACTNSLNSSGICCFCESDDNILLWSYYTDSHRGVSLKFDILADPDFFVSPLKMIYQNTYPQYNHLKNKQDLLKLLVRTKSEMWEHEKEVRVMKNSIGLHTFKKAALIEIVFGCKCADIEIERIKKLTTANGYVGVSFKKAIVKKFEYGLEFIDA